MSLTHHGIPGMHWGHRKGSTETPASPDHSKAHSLKKKPLSEMSNEELKTLSTRLQLEKQYKDARKQDVSSGKKFVSDILIGAGKTTAILYTAKYMGKGVEALIKVFKP